MSLNFSEIDLSEPYGVPPRKVNGGLYTGEAAKGDWGNVPVVPEAHVLVGENLKSANPPPEGVFHIPGYTRLGNNTQVFPGHRQLNPNYHVRCHD